MGPAAKKTVETPYFSTKYGEGAVADPEFDAGKTDHQNSLEIPINPKWEIHL